MDTPSDKEVSTSIAMGLMFGREDRRRNTIIGATGPGRNDPCPCGSGRKYKKCCLAVSKGTYQRDPAKLPRIRGTAANKVICDDVMEEATIKVAASTAAPASKNATAIAMLRAKVSRRIVWAYLETGVFITEANKFAHSPERLAKWEAALVAYDNASDEERMIMMAPASE